MSLYSKFIYLNSHLQGVDDFFTIAIINRTNVLYNCTNALKHVAKL